MLKPGEELRGIEHGGVCRVERRLGEGGQGEVYLVAGHQGPLAVKWYLPEQSTQGQKSAIRKLVRSGPPRGEAGKRFIWPLDLLERLGDPRFGYLMDLIDMGRFAELGEVQGRRKPQPGAVALCEIGFQAANSYRALHLAGFCYRDISAGNLMFDTVTGDVLICDNDNVGVNRHSECQVLGTWEFMAPELLLAKATPSTETDQHALAVLLFQLWMWHHPMHGNLECAVRSWDMPAKKRIYGEEPVFIFDPIDLRNRPDDPTYGTVRKRWEACPQTLKEAFVRAFGVGLKEPARRVTEGEWQDIFLKLQAGVLRCAQCSAENYWEPGMVALACWHCRKPMEIPPKLGIDRPGGRSFVLLSAGARLTGRALDLTGSMDLPPTVVAELSQNPADPLVWGLRNLTADPWVARFPDATMKDVPPQKSCPLRPGTRINIRGKEVEILA